MIWPVRIAFLALGCLVIGMTLRGKPALLITLGSITFFLGQWIAVARNRAKRGKVDDWTYDMADTTTLRGLDLILFILSLVVGIGLFVAGVVMVPSGA